MVRKRSSPKLIPLNTAFISAFSSNSFAEALDDPESWGRLVESAVGSHLINESQGTRVRVGYWRQSPKEVDFVLSKGDQRILIEVKSGGKIASKSGFQAFCNAYGKTPTLVVGRGGISVEEFLSTPPESWFPSPRPARSGHGISGMDEYEINMSFEYDMVPPPIDDTREPCLFLHVQVRERSTSKALAEICYARSRTFLHGGLVPDRDDRFDMLKQARVRLQNDYAKHIIGTRTTTRTDPIYLSEHSR